ncbi:solute carrier organic anion transporter family member 74D-like isoform X2 [Amphibalanus amphitrite]|uniref:solute carrier organic anion transporter family member 74D-like isoform X2 n=1 Tax=Amphibalanus amphitrite TaxID=1232801 RepID=UPI001C923932|nr:solute carrier organic anion transporter family member 74D-like isoform X2 [Amphibalanus amphitrite]
MLTYLLVYCSCGLIQGMWYTYFVSILTTVEKTFKFPSSVTGIVLAGNDVAQVFFAVLISYYGGRGNRPRWVGAGMLMNAVGCLLSALPQFVWGPDPDDIAAAMAGSLSGNLSSAAARDVDASLCHLDEYAKAAPTSDPSQCDTGDVSLVPVILLFLSQFVSGIGATAYYTLGLTYLDDSVDKKQSPVMFAISAGLRVMGPMLGFMLGSFSLSKFVIPSLKPTISQRDPRWIGAWWLGFFVLAGLLLAVSMLMCLFPKRLPSSKAPDSSSDSATTEETEEVMMDKLMGSMSELHTGARPAEQLGGLREALFRLFKNPLLMVMLLNVVFAVIGFIGYFTFMPKYQQAAFKQSAAKASLFSGLSGVLVTLAGYIGSGILIKLLRPRAVFVTGYSALVSGVQTCCMFALMAVRCPEAPMHGTLGDAGQFMLTADCNAGCGCNANAMAPVCSQDGMANFFSPCLAGCQTFSTINGTTTYGNCSCIVEVEGKSAPGAGTIFQHAASAVSGLCDIPCDSQFVTYMIILAVMKFVGSTNRTGGMLVFFRSVADADKSLAIGLATALMSVFAFIPAPILFGAVVDQTCLVWEEKACGGKGNCLYYDTDKLRVYLHTAVIIPFAISFLLDMVVIYLSRNLKLYGDDEDTPATKKGQKKQNNGTMDMPM